MVCRSACRNLSLLALHRMLGILNPLPGVAQDTHFSLFMTLPTQKQRAANVSNPL